MCLLPRCLFLSKAGLPNWHRLRMSMSPTRPQMLFMAWAGLSQSTYLPKEQLSQQGLCRALL